ncbi:MAG: PAS domain S-box protein [Bacteroidota bacterium]|nr:PAS domain S-box protein [Bacteroidota bacterium]
MEFFPETNEDHLQWLKYYQKAIDVNIITTITDHKGIIIYANDKFCEISGYTQEELIGQTHRIVNSNHHSKDFFKDLWDTISNGKPYQAEIRNKAKNGNYYWVDTVIIPVHLNNKIQYLSLRIVISEKKELEARNEEYIRSLENVLVMVSHEVRAPLASILGLLQFDYSTISKNEFNKILIYFTQSAEELDLCIKRLNLNLIEIKNKAKKKS